MHHPSVQSFFHEPSSSFSHVLSDPASGRAAIFDPVLDYDPASGRTAHYFADRLIEAVRSRGLVLDWIIETHVHADHFSAAPYLLQQLGGQVGIGARVLAVQQTFGELFNAGPEFPRDGSQFNRLFLDGDTYFIGRLPARVLYTPGHTPACTTHVVGDAAFVGDTLVMPDSGTARCDFPGGDPRALYHSIQRILALPIAMRLFLGHDHAVEGREGVCGETTVGAQRAANIHIGRGSDEEDFVRMRTARDATLGFPRLMVPAVQVNMRAGRLPPPESNGVRYLKLPLDVL